MPTDIPNAVYELFKGTQVPLTLSDPNLADDPMILANTAFYKLTGYGPAEVLGRNCRFMQGQNTRKSARTQIKEDFIARRDSRTLIRNYRKNGEEFDNYIYIFTVHDFDGKALYRIGSQFEVPMESRSTAFENHADELRFGLEKFNVQAESARQRIIDLSDLAAASVKDLLRLRLQSIRTQG
jgi:PAS domain S-box-containing protein